MIIWLLVGYMWLFVHRPFEIWSIFATIRLERSYMACVILVWTFSWLSNPNAKRPLGNIFTPALFLFTFAAAISSVLSPFVNVGDATYQDWLKYIVFFVILMTSVKTEKDLKIIVTGFVIAVFLFMAHSYREYLCGHVRFVVGAPRLVGVGVTFNEFNDYGTMLVCMLPMLFPLVTLCKKNWHYLFVLGYALLTLRSVMLTGSRTAFVMLCGLMILPILFSRYRFRLIPIILVAAPLGWLVMPESLQNRYRTVWNPTINQEANRNLHARFQGFYEGMENWSNYPIFGVGPGCHGPAAGTPLQAHNLPGQLAGETGTFGVTTLAVKKSS